ncbi:haloacid dehalogenase type II [Kaarinaea lacus]
MTVTLAFDVYGTLIDTHGVVVELEKFIGARAAAFSQTWRDKQLEYSFRRGLMRRYEKFSVCIKDAFEYTCSYYKVQLNQEDKNSVLDTYKVLPAFADVKQGLEAARSAGFQMFAFSNGSAEMVEGLLVNAELVDYFIDIVSVDEVQSFKPDPAVYHHFLKRAGASPENAWLVSSNPFDVIGAIASGMQAAWVKRSPEAVFDPWGITPTITVNSLIDLSHIIADKM